MQQQEIKLEEWESTLVGRIYVEGRRTSAYVIPCDDNRDLFTPEQLLLIDNQMF